MKILSTYPTSESDTGSLSDLSLCIGNFDGVHLGHRAILDAARGLGGRLGVLTFWPHPRVILSPEKTMDFLTTPDERRDLLKSLGVEVLIEQPFSREFSQMSAREFFDKILCGPMKLRALVVGYDFAFGRNREGDFELLKEWSQEVKMTCQQVAAAKDVGGAVISSTRIRSLIQAGDMPSANSGLGYPFFYRGVVVRGSGRGRQLGFRTANLRLQMKIVPPYGVYVTQALLNGQIYSSVTNVGVRPTVTEPGEMSQALVETHLIDQDLDLYGHTLEVRFLERLRGETKFASRQDLVDQIKRDIDQARNKLSNVKNLIK